MKSPLSTLLGSRSRAEILRLLFGEEPRELHIRDLARQSRMTAPVVRKELGSFHAQGLVRLRQSGNRSYYSANPEHPLHTDLRHLVAKTTGIAPALARALGTEGIACAFVFGSVARGEERAASDVDLMILGSLGLRDISRRLGSLGLELGREINVHSLKPREFASRLRVKDRFLDTVMKSEKIFVVGGSHELERLAG